MTVREQAIRIFGAVFWNWIAPTPFVEPVLHSVCLLLTDMDSTVTKL